MRNADTFLSLIRPARRRGGRWFENLPAPPSLPGAYGIPTSGLQSLYVAGADEFANVPQLGDDSGLQRYLIASSDGDDPGFSATAIGGTRPGITFAGGQITAAAVADWKHLHQDGASAVVYFHPTGVLNNQVVLSTRLALPAAECGFLLNYDGGVNHRLYAVQYNDTVQCLNIAGTNQTAPTNNAYRVIFRVDSTQTPDAEIRLNGASYVTGNYVAARSNNNPNRALRLGNATGLAGLNNLTGAIGVVATYNRRLTDLECTTWEGLLSTMGSLRTTITVRALGDSITGNAASWRVGFWTAITQSTFWRAKMVGSQAASGNFPLGDRDHDGVSGETIAQIAARIAGGPACTDLVICAGTNDMGGSVSAAIAAMSNLLDTAKTLNQQARIWVFAIPYGLGGVANLTLAGNAGTYNAQLETLCAAKGVHFINTHAGATAWVPATHASDDTGHPNVAGGNAMGRTAAVAMGIAA